ncbi:MAG: hypothetical protein LBS97_01815 [Treponema sp.]|jgi:hypothetical protein|nr:hypothetical protein [Treponema sp.]
MKKHIMLLGALAGVVLALAFVTMGCENTNTPDDPKITGFTFTQTAGLRADNANTAAGAVAGTFSKAASDGGTGAFTYTLVDGDGDSNNGLFTITGTELKVGSSALTAGNYTVRVQAKDTKGKTFAKACGFTVAEPAFVAVTNITGAPSSVYVNTPLALTGTVVPANATNKTIVWSINPTGTTAANAELSGNSLTAGGDGTVKVIATIANGTALGTAYTQTIDVIVSAAEPGAAITGLGGTLQIGETVIATAATTENSGVVTWASSAPAVASINASTGAVSALTAGTATISYTTPGGVVPPKTNSAAITIHPAAQTLSPVYAPFTGAAGTTATPSNAAEISTAKGGSTAAFAIVGGGTAVATINTGTGELTLVDGGAITVSLTITTAGGVVTHKGTSAAVTVTRDTTAPTISAGSVEDLTTTAGTTATLEFTSDEVGTYYYLVLAASANAPSAATIQAQGTAVAKGSAAASASQNTISVTGLMAGTQYKAYIVVKDAAGNVSAVLTMSGVNPAVDSLADFLARLSSNAVNNGDYTYELNADETIAPTELSYSGKTVKVTLRGATAERTVNLSSNGSMFTVGSGVTLTLDDNVTLQGRTSNTDSLVRVNSGGTLAMKGTAKITGNTASFTSYGTYGGGVYVIGSFTMSDNAAITGNTASSTSSYHSYGGGVYSRGSFTMSDNATITGNTATDGVGVSRGHGGGVHVSGGSFTMSDNAAITGNTATDGGGVSSSGSFTMSDNATVSDNTASGSGGGVSGSGSFTMSDSAAITGNTATDGGGVSGSGSFTMSDNATVSGNTASGGGGVYFSGGSTRSFTMSDNATISGNTASSVGGGVYVYSGSFTMSVSATFSGNTAGLGGGVYFSGSSGSNFTMSDSATVSDNRASSGGGVYSSGSFTMSGSATISGNRAFTYGGGVYVHSGSFTKTGGTIYGDTNNTHTADSTENTAFYNDGHAVYVSSSGKKRNSTAGMGVNLDSSTTANWEY